MKRILSLLLTVAITMCLLSGCNGYALGILMDYFSHRMEWEPVVDNPYLIYTLDQALLDSFYAALEKSEQLSTAGENMEAIELAADQLDEIYTELIDQVQIAYILYCTDMEDGQLRQQYLEAEELCTQAEADYNAMAKRVYLSGTPVRDQLFADWTQEEIHMLLLYNDEIRELQQRNTEITVAYRELDDESFETDMIPLYNELVSNNNRIAYLYGYEDYYTYASQIIYQRDYGGEQLKQLRDLTARYLPQVCDGITEQFYSLYEELDEDEQDDINELLGEDYDLLAENYVQQYLEDLPQPARKSMEEMFTRERVVFTDAYDAYMGAFTVWIDGVPFCYFGPYYQDSETVVHELGHYYGGSFMEPWEMPMDICETQSQGNEWLYLRFLEDHLQPNVYSSLSAYKLMTELSEILAFVVLDEFEQRIYCHEHAGDMTEEEFEALLEEVAEPYGGITYIRDNILNLSAYWKQVLLESPVYYLSYAVSSFAAVDLYLSSLEDEESARDIYCKLIEEADAELGFVGNICGAGLSGPFEESIYETLYEHYGK